MTLKELALADALLAMREEGCRGGGGGAPEAARARFWALNQNRRPKAALSWGTS